MKPHCRDVARLLVFTDLDGSLLDHHSYSYAAAGPALTALRERGVPLILTSSKTFAEIAELAGELGLNYPYIVENGAGVVIPDGCLPSLDLPRVHGVRLQTFGAPLARILEILQRLRTENGVRFRGFSEMDAAEVVRRTGLAAPAARLARQRFFSEPIAWEDDEEAWSSFARQLEVAGLYTLRGGRFIHVMAGGDKGIALAWLRDRYQQVWHRQACTMALGDSENDLAMLERADIPVVIRSPVHPPPAGALDRHYPVTDLPGPVGWNQAVMAIVTAQSK